MNLSRTDHDVFVPDGESLPEALARTTHLCIGAHQDDQEFMAYHGIAVCFGQSDRWFTGVVVTDGGGSVRCGPYAERTNEEMMAIRQHEQRKAAVIGEYACQIQLGYPSRIIKDAKDESTTEDLYQILLATCPETVYLHNPTDKHDTHVATLLRCIAALRKLPQDARPKLVVGCEVWRSLDWLCDADKVAMDVEPHRNLRAALSGVFDSQIAGGKSYDLAVTGRQAANATFFESHAVDASLALSWCMDLTCLIVDDTLTLEAYALSYIERFQEEVQARIQRFA